LLFCAKPLPTFNWQENLQLWHHGQKPNSAKVNGYQLPRDASQQVETGKEVSFIDNGMAGDLAFFDNEEGNITHVGILLGSKEILHASGSVRIDPIDHQGIFNKEKNQYTHKLRIIKRFL
jgi:hypothetical protein